MSVTRSRLSGRGHWAGTTAIQRGGSQLNQLIQRRPLPFQERLNFLLKYCPETGLLTWKISKGSSKAGDKAGKYGVTIDNQQFEIARVIWKMLYDEEPVCVDHRNGNKLDYRLSNLRAATLSNNTMNSVTLLGSSGVRGVVRNRRNWQARITINQRTIILGTYLSIEEAALVRRQAEEKYFGEWSYTNSRGSQS